MKQKFLSFLIALAAALSVAALTAPTANAAHTLITDPEAVSGRDFTDSAAMASTLDDIFNGNAGIYRDLACTVPVDTTLGTSPVRNNGVYMYVDPVDGMATNIGTSCWIYANGVYYTLFGESTGMGIGENSEKLYLGNTASRILSYQNFQTWGVRQGVGALVRASGHSMIVLGYDEDTLTVLDGNGNGRGLVAINVYSWDELYSCAQYIIQPKESHYSALYACGSCGDGLSWSVDDEGTLTISGSGRIQSPSWGRYNFQIKKAILLGDAITIDTDIFRNCGNLKEIIFRGNAPVLSENAFSGMNVTVRYPAAKDGWHADMLNNYGGSVNWEPYGMTELKITGQPETAYTFDGSNITVTVNAQGDGLTYHWYYKDAQAELYQKASCAGSAYSIAVSELAVGRQVLCAVQDQYGNFAVSESVLLRAELS